jgi:hypothetical protein
MASYVSPGVYIREQDFSLYAQNLSTTIVAMVGGAAKGPTNQPVQITSHLQFVDVFGQPTTNFYGPYAALQFLEEGSTLYYTRVTGAAGYAALYQSPTDETSGVGSITLTNGGTTYTSAPGVKLTGGGGINDTTPTATATAQISGGAVIGFTITNPGYGYTGAPTVVVTGGGGTNAAGTAVLGTTGDTSGSVLSVAGTFLVGSGTASLVINNLVNTTGTLVTTPFSVTVLQGATQSATNVVSDITGTTNYATQGWTAAVYDTTKVKITSKSKDNLIGVSVDSSSTFVGFTDNTSHFGADINALPATVIGSIAGPVDILANASNDTLTITEEDRRSGTLVSTVRTVALTHNTGVTLSTIAGEINTAATGWNVAADASSGVLVITSESIENELFGLKIGGNAATTLGLASSQTFVGAVAKWLVQAASVGAWGNDLNVKIGAGTRTGTFKVSVSYLGVLQEAYDNVTYTDPSSIDYVNSRVNVISKLITITDNPSVAGPPALTGSDGANLNYGNDGLDDIDYIGSLDPILGATGLQIYRDPEALNINLLAVPGVPDPAVINEMLDICTTRADAMCLIDPPLGLSSQQVIDWHNGEGVYTDHQAFNSSYGALYWPWLQIFDPVNNVKVWTPPSGHVARVYAFTDRSTETWYAPAGTNRGHIIPALLIEHSASRAERDLLAGQNNDFLTGDGNAVNPIIMIPQRGITIWGERTLQRSATALDRVNVRRLLLYMEKVVSRLCLDLVFEPNDTILWGRFVDTITPFCSSIKARRGLTDFAVRCDQTTNPPDAIDRGELHGFILLKPTKTAEEIIVTFTLTSTSAQFSEIQSF